MEFSLKKQLNLYQEWINLANQIELTELKAINRYSILTFLFIFVAVFYIVQIATQPNNIAYILVLLSHLFLGLNILKAKAVVDDSLKALKHHEKLNQKVAIYLNKEYSLFLVSQGKKPLSQSAIDTLEVHTSKFVDGKMTRGGRADSIRRFRISFLKKESKFYNYLFGFLLLVEMFVIL